MSVQRYRLTPLGWLGAALFVLPTPIAAWISSPAKLSPGEDMYKKTLAEVSGTIPYEGPSLFVVTLLATSTLVGLVMLLVGRELHQD
ncbi:hypothetical protein ACFO1V_03170 [Daeguia caeni]|uniref:NADH-ubiquinone oxidoreductase chain 6 n=1 Tax=Daeguia caeni TaxID=439612 RepID=A0ABV9H1C5_9HYPH